jgi:hypothetical protein
VNEQTVLKEVHMANKYMKGLSTPLAIKEMQIKMTRRFHVTPVRIAIIKKTNNNKYRRGCGEKGSVYTVD